MTMSSELSYFEDFIKEYKIRIIKQIAKDKKWDSKDLIENCLENNLIKIPKK